jgi:SAM-dependent methyltransferase
VTAGRYEHLGPIYDAVSLEVLYRRPRRRLADLFGALPGAVVVDLGCGTGRNLAWLRRAVAPGGRVVGVDASASMLGAAHRRARRMGWSDVTLLPGDVRELADVLAAAHVRPDAFVATFALSLVPDTERLWAAVDDAAVAHPARVGLAELGRPDGAPRVLRPALDALTAFGGGDPSREAWRALAERATDLVHETFLGGHVHVAVGTCGGQGGGPTSPSGS